VAFTDAKGQTISNSPANYEHSGNGSQVMARKLSRQLAVPLMLIFGLVSSVPGAAQTPAPSNSTTSAREREATEAEAQAIIYGLPLVMMGLTVKRSANVFRPRAVDHLAQAPNLPPAAFNNIALANVGTHHSSFMDDEGKPLNGTN
jgi:hypothetical protein